MCLDERVVIDVSKETHDELAVHAICYAAMARDGVAKVLDLERALETGSEEATEGSDEGGEGGKDEGVELHGSKGYRERSAGGEEEEFGKLESVGEENGVDVAVEASENIGAEILQSG